MRDWRQTLASASSSRLDPWRRPLQPDGAVHGCLPSPRARFARDSGGSLIGALLRDGLVDEISLLVHPSITGGAGERAWHGGEPVRALGLERIAAEPLDRGLTWLRYRISTADGS